MCDKIGSVHKAFLIYDASTQEKSSCNYAASRTYCYFKAMPFLLEHMTDKQAILILDFGIYLKYS